MILDSLELNPVDFERRTGWAIKPEGACKAERCVPLALSNTGHVDVAALAERLGMPLVRDVPTGLYALGPESGGRALSSAVAPDFTLPDWLGREFTLSSLRGRKVALVTWASW